jgi:hypothetical protein
MHDNNQTKIPKRKTIKMMAMTDHGEDGMPN